MKYQRLSSETGQAKLTTAAEIGILQKQINSTVKVLTRQFRCALPVRSFYVVKKGLFRCIDNTKLLSLAIAWPANFQKLLVDYSCELRSNA